ncbi:hypothetical protein ACFZLS_005174, partial [Escherichia coli]
WSSASVMYCWGKRRRYVMKNNYKAQLISAHKKAFRIATLSDVRLIHQIRDVLVQAMASGNSWHTTIKQLRMLS